MAKENTLKSHKDPKKQSEGWKKTKRILRKMTKKEFLFKAMIVASGLALIATSVLPYILN